MPSKICVVSSSSKPNPTLRNVIEILRRLFSEEQVIIVHSKSFTSKAPRFARQITYIFDEIILSAKLLRFLPKVNMIFMFQEYHLFVALLAHFSRKKTVLFVGGSEKLGSYYRYKNQRSVFAKTIYASTTILVNFCATLSDSIIAVTQSIVDSESLTRHQKKISFAPIFPRTDTYLLFVVEKEYGDRKQIIGFVGGLERIKGVMSFVDAIPYILKKLSEVSVMIIGEGDLGDTIKLKLKKYNVLDSVKFLGQVAHSELPRYYNNFRLLVLPSYSEGIPSVILEAMSCGTPVLATPVGGIPEIIKDRETGFLLKSKDSKHIADEVVELLNNTELLEEVSKNAYGWIRENFTEEKTLESWREIIQRLENL